MTEMKALYGAAKAAPVQNRRYCRILGFSAEYMMSVRKLTST
jgi:hypothetical protein